MQRQMTMEVILKERVRYHETDAGGGANERAFIYWFDAARAACLRKYPLLLNLLSAGEIAIKTEELFLKVAGKRVPVYDDSVEVTVRFALQENDSIKYDYEVKCSDDGTAIASGYSVHNLFRDGAKIEKNEFKEILKER
jgi:acyl-CoA thioesterase FadM